MNTTPHVSGNIVVGVDGSSVSTLAVSWAADTARMQRRPVTLVHALRRPSASELAWLSQAAYSLPEVTAAAEAEGRELLEHARELVEHRAPGIDVGTVLQTGDAREILLDLAAEAALVVVGTRGHGRVAGLLLGSVSTAVVKQAPCPVAVVRPYGDVRRGVLVGDDGTEDAGPSLEAGFREASWRGLPLTVAHVRWDPFYSDLGWAVVGDREDDDETAARVRVAESMAGLREKFPDVHTTVTVVHGDPATCLADLSRHYDLVVLGRHQRTLGQRLLLGAVGTTVVEHAHAPVLVVP